MTRYHISNPEIAEAIFHYISREDVYEDFCDVCSIRDLSMAEFICIFKQEMFKNYCRDIWDIEVYF